MSKDILDDIINDFEPEKFIKFFRSRNPSFSPRQEDLTQYNDDNFKKGKKLGEINFKDNSLIVYSFQADQPLSEKTGKKAQYEKGKKILKETQADAGIFIYYDQSDNFRFSLIYANYLGSRRDWSTFRRFTYFVSREFTNKTFLQRIGDGDFSSLDKIKEAFSVEKVTNIFFDECQKIFQETKKEFEKTNKNSVCLWLKVRYSEEEYKEQVNKFAYTFIGRIIFVYFLLRKGWIENKKDYLRTYIEDSENTELYLNFLQPLFFEVFATKESERSQKIQDQYKDTPYLNGGLFEKSELERQMEKESIFILFDDKFIRRIILEFFENYNFTVDENSPDDQEVSIDPEMLGKVFENTLAEEERGQKGTFYTPREIVHFMVKDSLLQYLVNETGLPMNILSQFIYNTGFDLDSIPRDKIRLIDKKLEVIKVLDPAVGSAAFPVEMMQVLVDLRKRLDVKVGKNISEVNLKKQFIKNNLYGVDIDSGAIEIAKLRIWLALIVDYTKSEIEPLPNLDFQFRVGNSLQEKIDDIDIFRESGSVQQDLFESESEYQKMKQKMIVIKDEFYGSDNENRKKTLKKEFDELEHKLIQAVLEKYGEDFSSQLRNLHIPKFEKKLKDTMVKIARLENRVKDGTYKLFKPDFHFSEVFDRKDENGEKIGGFDIVIGNPPYGVKVEDDIKTWHGLGSGDSYGIFISTSLKRFLKPGGVLSFIVSDTWLTIKTHKELREQVLEKQLLKVVRLNQDCFDATVNACIIILANSSDENKSLLAGDLTNISTRKEVEELREKLYHLENFIAESTPKFAVYEYPQDLIKTNSNLPIFVGSPKLFALMNDTTYEIIEKEIGEKDKKKIKFRQVEVNGKIVELVRFGDIAEIRAGLQTGENKRYLFQNPEVRGGYRNINDYKKYLLTDKDLEKIANNDSLRKNVIEKGLHKSKNESDFDENLWFGGRYIVPYDKGGESNTESGWLPNYYVPTNYFIDWSQGSIKRVKTYRSSKQGGKIASRFQNSEAYFVQGLTWSDAGYYSPTVRLSGRGVFDVKGSRILVGYHSSEFINALLVSKLLKYWIKNINNHTVSTQVDDFRELGIIFESNKKLDILAEKIIEKQKQNPRYDYMSNEQKEIDKLVYEMYGLDVDDIHEVENWYARRYPKLARFCDI